MEIAIAITDQLLYNSEVDEVNTEKLKVEGGSCFTGLIEIYKKSGTLAPFYGLIEADDFEREYGFVIETIQ